VTEDTDISSQGVLPHSAKAGHWREMCVKSSLSETHDFDETSKQPFCRHSSDARLLQVGPDLGEDVLDSCPRGRAISAYLDAL